MSNIINEYNDFDEYAEFEQNGGSDKLKKAMGAVTGMLFKYLADQPALKEEIKKLIDTENTDGINDLVFKAFKKLSDEKKEDKSEEDLKKEIQEYKNQIYIKLAGILGVSALVSTGVAAAVSPKFYNTLKKVASPLTSAISNIISPKSGGDGEDNHFTRDGEDNHFTRDVIE
jgi:glutathionyl-hydroquinone reductase